MTCLTAAVADAVKDALNNGSWSQEFKAVRKWIAAYNLPDLKALHVTVLPGPISQKKLSRGRDDVRRMVDIAIQQKVNPEDNGEIDPLGELFEEFLQDFRTKELTADGRKVCVVDRQAVSAELANISKELLNEVRCFNSVLRLDCQVLGVQT